MARTSPEGTHPAPTFGTELIVSICPWMDGNRATQEQFPMARSYCGVYQMGEV
jgi:hypothetical protein